MRIFANICILGTSLAATTDMGSEVNQPTNQWAQIDNVNAAESYQGFGIDEMMLLAQVEAEESIRGIGIDEMQSGALAQLSRYVKEDSFRGLEIDKRALAQIED